MFSLIKKKLKILSCSKYFTNVEVKNILHPSELDHRWRNRQKIQTKSETDFLYVGRFKRDKGAYYLADIFKNLLNWSLNWLVEESLSSIKKLVVA